MKSVDTVGEEEQDTSDLPVHMPPLGLELTWSTGW